jgi:hypothetical protein
MKNFGKCFSSANVNSEFFYAVLNLDGRNSALEHSLSFTICSPRREQLESLKVAKG